MYMAVKFTKVRAASTVFEDREDEEEANGGEEVPPVQVNKPPNNMRAILKAKKFGPGVSRRQRLVGAFVCR